MTRISRTRPTLLLGLIAISFISFATILLMLDLTSNVVEPGLHAHKRKSPLGLFTSESQTGIRSILGQLAIFQSGALKLKQALPRFKCKRPSFVHNVTEAQVRTDTSPVTLDELSWETFDDHSQTVGKMSHVADQMVREMNTTAVVVERNQTIDEVFEELGLLVGLDDGFIYLPGGHWKPKSCAPKWKVAIVIPFRDRVGHLAIFLRHIIPFLKRQNLEFSVFVVEQNNDKSFNRAMLLNVGYLEALKMTRYDCFIFHDVDHLAININNYYGCDSMPRHFISGDDVWGYTIVYQELFGGVTGMTRNQMQQVNGFSNVYWGWGGEDDDLYRRIVDKGLFRSRPEGAIGFYNTIRHTHKKQEENFQRLCLLHFCNQRMASDGLNNIQYDRPTIELTPLFTKISVDIRELPWKTDWVECEPIMDLFRPPNQSTDYTNGDRGDQPGPPPAAKARRGQARIGRTGTRPQRTRHIPTYVDDDDRRRHTNPESRQDESEENLNLKLN